MTRGDSGVLIYVMAKGNDLRKENIKAVRRCFYEGGTWSLRELEEQTGLSHGSAVNVIRELENRQEILLSEKTGNTVGRKTYRYILNPGYLHLCTVSVRRENEGFVFEISVIDLSGAVLDHLVKENGGISLDGLAEAIGEMLSRHPGISMILVSSPGICRNGVIYNQGRYEYDLGSVIRRKWSLPYVIENDVNVACIGFHKEYPESENIALVYQAQDTVFGCGVMIRGKLYNGFSHAAGELRYTPVMRDPSGYTAKELLQSQILSTAAVLNPEVIGYCSEVCAEEISLADETLPEHHRPKLVCVRQLEPLTAAGMHSIGMHNIVERTGGIGE